MFSQPYFTSTASPNGLHYGMYCEAIFTKDSSGRDIAACVIDSVFWPLTNKDGTHIYVNVDFDQNGFPYFVDPETSEPDFGDANPELQSYIQKLSYQVSELTSMLHAIEEKVFQPIVPDDVRQSSMRPPSEKVIGGGKSSKSTSTPKDEEAFLEFLKKLSTSDVEVHRFMSNPSSVDEYFSKRFNRVIAIVFSQIVFKKRTMNSFFEKTFKFLSDDTQSVQVAAVIKLICHIWISVFDKKPSPEQKKAFMHTLSISLRDRLILAGGTPDAENPEDRAYRCAKTDENERIAFTWLFPKEKTRMSFSEKVYDRKWDSLAILIAVLQEPLTKISEASLRGESIVFVCESLI